MYPCPSVVMREGVCDDRKLTLWPCDLCFITPQSIRKVRVGCITDHQVQTHTHTPSSNAKTPHFHHLTCPADSSFSSFLCCSWLFCEPFSRKKSWIYITHAGNDTHTLRGPKPDQLPGTEPINCRIPQSEEPAVNHICIILYKSIQNKGHVNFSEVIK